MTENEKFQLEFVTIEELCQLAQTLKIEIEKLERDMRLFGKEDDDFPKWKNELWDKKRRYRFIIKRIQSRQMKIF